MAYHPKKCSSNWAVLPGELVNLILDKLMFHLEYYIRFSVVCKSWNSITVSHYKEKRIPLINHQLPWLLVNSHTEKRLLYNLTTSEICNFRLRIPFDDKNMTLCGSSHGWLFFWNSSPTEEFALILSNPFSGTIIHLPPFDKRYFNHTVTSVRLSRDPSLGPFEVLAAWSNEGSDEAAHLKSGDEFWSYSKIDHSSYPKRIHDLIFFKGRMFGIFGEGQILSLDVMESSRCIKFNELVSTLEVHHDIQNCFAETTNGELIMVRRYFGEEEYETIAYKLYKLIYSNDSSAEQLEVIPIKNLGGDSLFLADCDPTISVSASNYNGCVPNSIYYSGDIACLYRQIEVFNLEDGNAVPCCLPREYYKPNGPASTWVVPMMVI